MLSVRSSAAVLSDKVDGLLNSVLFKDDAVSSRTSSRDERTTMYSPVAPDRVNQIIAQRR